MKKEAGWGWVLLRERSCHSVLPVPLLTQNFHFLVINLPPLLKKKKKSDLIFKIPMKKTLFYVTQNGSNTQRLIPLASKHMINHKLSH